MGWGQELWDQRGKIESATEENIQFVGTCKNLISQMSEVENAYAKSIRKVLKVYQSTIPVDNSTAAQAYRALLNAFDVMAQSHEQIADKLNREIQEPMGAQINEAKKTRQDLLAEGAALDKVETKEMAALVKERKKYDKIEKDADDAQIAYEKADKSDNVTKAKVEKFRKDWEKKSKLREHAEMDLKAVNDKANEFRTTHYQISIPAVLDKQQMADEARAVKLVARFNDVARAFDELGSNTAQGIANLKEAVSKHNAPEDSKTFISLYKSNRGPPQDLPLHPPGTPRATTQAQTNSNAQQQPPPQAQRPQEEDEALPPGPANHQCKIMYDFAGTNEGELQCFAGEILNILSNDGSGWVLASKNDGTQGYVPESYIG